MKLHELDSEQIFTYGLVIVCIIGLIQLPRCSLAERRAGDSARLELRQAELNAFLEACDKGQQKQ